MILNVKKLDRLAVLPKYQTKGAACFDLHTIETKGVPANDAAIFRTGLAVEVPEGHVMLIYSRSGHGFKNGLRLVNSVGVIDSDYRGEIAIKIYNDSPIGFSFVTGSRIAQAMIVPLPSVEIFEVDELSNTERGSDGFGSTGS